LHLEFADQLLLYCIENYFPYLNRALALVQII
jgi:hypothetical protein